MTQKKYETSGNNAVHQHLPGLLRVRRPEKRRREEKGEEEVERKIVALQRIVPGGESRDPREVEKLFEETAEYILALQNQVKTMRVLASFFEGLGKENMKLGG
ncbi:hypothetical protein LguiA_022177 [Lonicera macranthoides]